MLLVAGLLILVIALFPYVIYLCGIFFGKKPDESPVPERYPPVSVIMPAYNEENFVERRIGNLEEQYPKESMEIIFVDDHSSDNTLSRVKAALGKSGIAHTVIANEERMGTNRSFNAGISRAKYPIIVTTGADLVFAPDAMKLAIGRLLSAPDIAAVTTELQPTINATGTSQMEGAYRSVYGKMCEWESAHDSTYNFNGGLIAFRTDLIQRINDKRGSDDANTAFEAIRRGYRAVYERRSVVFEDIPPVFSSQYHQKIRRAKRLIEATLGNLDLLKMKRPFTRFFYPLRIFMYVFTPFLFFLGLALFAIGVFFVSLVALLGLVVLAAVGLFAMRKSLVGVFVLNQVFLLAGLLNMGKDTRVWESTSVKK